MHLLIDIWQPRHPASAGPLYRLLLGLPGVVSAQVDGATYQASVVLGPQVGLTAADLEALLAEAGYHVRVTPVPDPEEDSDYARYFHAAPDAPEAWWYT